MDVEFVSRDAWRRPGRPRRPADPAIVALLERTYATGSAARVPIDPGTQDAEVRELVAQLQRAARELGKYLRVQPRRTSAIIRGGQICFYIEDAA